MKFWVYVVVVLAAIVGGDRILAEREYRFPIGQEISYQTNNEYVLTLETESQPLTESESIHLKFRTRQQDNSVIALGRTNEHSFKIELVGGRLVFHFTDDSDLTISSYSLPVKHLNDGEWHRLIVHRSQSKFEVVIDTLKYSDITFNKHLTENVFAGSRITLGYISDFDSIIKYDGEISEVVISVNNIPLQIKEQRIPYNDLFNNSNSAISSTSGGIDKVIIRVDMAPGASVSLKSGDSPLTLIYNTQKHVDSFGVSFKLHSDGIVASLIGSQNNNFVGLEVVQKNAFIVVKSNNNLIGRKPLGPVDYSSEHTVHLRNDRQGDTGVISAWLTSNRQSPVSFKVTDPFLIDKISFGGEKSEEFVNPHSITGCINKPYLNLFTLNLKPLLSDDRRECLGQSVFPETKRRLIDHVEGIMFRYGDRPLPFTYAENDRRRFGSLQLEFATLESSGIIASLHDNKDNFMALFIEDGLLFMIIDDRNIEHQSFKVSDNKVNDGQYHMVNIVNSDSSKDYIELDSQRTLFPQQIVYEFDLTTVYFAAADFWAKDHYGLGGIGNFYGCMRNILLNNEYIIRYDHVLDKSRVNVACQPVIHKPLPSISYLKPDVSFSCKEQKDVVNLNLPNSEEFNSIQLPVNTFIDDGIVATLSSSFDKKSIILYVQNGGLNLAYLDNKGKELHLTTGKLINDGDNHRIHLKREPGRVVLSVNDQIYNVDIPIGSSPLFFDKLTIGGPNELSRFMPNKQGVYQGCFRNIEYNKASIVPISAVTKERQQCVVLNKNVCDVSNNMCKIRSKNIEHKFCPSKKCSVFCQATDKSIVGLYRPLEISNIQKINIVMRTNELNAQLFRTTNKNDGISFAILLKSGYLVLNIENNKRTITLDFPKKIVSDAAHHTLSVSRLQNQVNLSVDDSNIVHNVKSLLRRRFFFNDHEICNGRYQGYIQDAEIGTDQESVNILHEIVDKPEASRIGPAAIWENRFALMKREGFNTNVNCSSFIKCADNQISCRAKRNSYADNNKICICVHLDGKEKTICEDPCSQHQCYYGQCLNQNGVPICQCNHGYVGERCDQLEDPCLRSPCMNGGTCYSQGTTSFHCQCTVHFSGERCEIPVQHDPCQHVYCKNNGQCHNGRCQCPPDFTGTYCEHQIDPCVSIRCENNGQCIRGNCHCQAGTSGQYCEHIDPCYNVHCQNNGVCQHGRCHCPEPFSGDFCENYDHCHGVTCLHGGICENGHCMCPLNRGGSQCEIENQCYNIHCENNGQCHDGRCHCPQGFTGSFCERIGGYRNQDKCSTCSNHGFCIDDKCICEEGFVGSSCESTIDQIDLCMDVACHDGGYCVDGHCVCLMGYSGEYCEHRDLCFSVNCINGYCHDGNCVCPPGYSGPNCAIKDLCHDVKCVNGRCVNGACQCDVGYEGIFCEHLVKTVVTASELCVENCEYEEECICPDVLSACSTLICMNGGKCVNGRCVCVDPYSGDKCQFFGPFSEPAQGLLEGGLIPYGRIPRSRGKHLGAIFAIASGLALGALAGAFAARKCAEGACSPGTSTIVTTIPVTNENASPHPIATMIERTVPTVFHGESVVGASSAKAARFQKTEDEQMLLPSSAIDRDASATERIETIHERTIERHMGDSASTSFFSTLPMVYTNLYSGQHPTERLVEAQLIDDNHLQTGTASFAYHPPPIQDFGYGPSGGHIGYSDVESWDTSGAAQLTGTQNLHMMNAKSEGTGLSSVEYELSNINTLTMTPNGKYAIVGQSQGPPQIWDAQTGNLINSLYGNCNNCIQLSLACNGSLLVGLSSDVSDTQPCIVQIWDINTGRPIHLSHQIKCSAFTLSNNTNNLIMAGNQKYGRGISVGILDLVSNELTKELKSDTQTNLGRDPSFIELTPDECYAIIGCYNQLQSMTNYVVFDLTVAVDVVQPPCISLDCEPKRCVVLNNRECISGLNNGQLFMWDLISCKPIHYFCDGNLDRTAHRSQINDIQLSSDRSLLITASNDGTAKIWDTVSRTLVSRLLGHHQELTCACLSSNQSLAVTGSLDQHICLWRIPNGQLAAQMNIGMVPIQVNMASENRTVVSIAERDGERQLLMLRVVSSPTLQSATPQR